MPVPDRWIVFVVAASGAALLVTAAYQLHALLSEWRARRDAMRTLDEPGVARARSGAPDEAVLQERREPGRGFVGGLAERIPRLWDLAHLVGQAGLDWSLDGFVLRSVLFAAVPGLALLWLTRSILAAAIPAVVGGSLPYLYARWKKRRRLRVLEAQLPDAIDLLARAVRAGHPLSEGVRMVSEEAPEPQASEFRIVFEEQRFGLPFEEALLGLGDRVELVDVRILITAILVQREVGGNLAEILGTIAETMRARFALKRQVRVYTAQGRMSGYTLAALPILVGSAIFLINPDYIRMLFHEPVGRWLLVGAASMQLVGFIWIRRIIDVEF